MHVVMPQTLVYILAILVKISGLRSQILIRLGSQENGI